MTFLEFFNREVSKARVAPKSSSGFMQFVGWSLQLLRIMKSSTFMERYTTTIGDTIYSDHLTPKSGPNCLFLHELVHVVQDNIYGLSFRLGYIFSKKKRLLYESNAIQVEILYRPHLELNIELQKLASDLVHYHIPFSEAYQALQQRVVEIKSGEVSKEAKVVYECLRKWEKL